MAAWTLARVPADQSVVEPGSSQAEKFVGKVLKWVPADLVVIYTGLIKAVVDDANDTSNYWVTAGFVVAAPVTVLLLAFASGPRGIGGSKLWVRAILSMPAAAIWSATVPNSGWDEIQWVTQHLALTAGLAGAAGFFFSLIADGIEQRIG
jgi:hypothetical protein